MLRNREWKLSKRALLPVLVGLSASALTACADKLVGVPAAGTVQIRLRTSGGFTGSTSTILLDGADRIIVGEACSGICTFTPGEVLATVSGQEVAQIAGRFRAAGILDMDGADYGVECCDQEYVELWYTDEDGTSVVEGTLSLLPSHLAEAVSAFRGMVPWARPVVVDFEGDPSQWPQVPLEIRSPKIAGDLLSVEVSYSGGCREHDIQAVAWGGWMSSVPPQVRVFLSHDDQGDTCEAFLTETRVFDLTPLKEAYQADHGVRPPGTTTLRVLLEDPRLASPLGAWILYYTF